MKSNKILLVDDHPALRFGVAGLIQLNHLGKVVGEAGNGEEAVAKVKELKPDLVIMDFSMPKMDGLKATREIRKFAAAQLKILMLTMHTAEQMSTVALEAGADLVLEKTASQQLLVKAILKLCEPTSANKLFEEMVTARGEWLREADGHASALGVFHDTEGGGDGATGLRMAVSRETTALKRYRAAVYAWTNNWHQE